ncbi:MAG: helix-turn-helix domain-containing protein [Rhodobacteraceae bacterium]|jgi:IclR family pca regulon transcriptional regulator|nr:helix-turn-helix domain-containing protein [Alphaproteobacteria bacterium]MBT8477114.1 helix-turn-helix domain-containing protein [Alphaproteobacteria bacterium]NNK66188.1 helix-turn-helix domain-containing protein [Paracoccaceae bacterium]
MVKDAGSPSASKGKQGRKSSSSELTTGESVDDSQDGASVNPRDYVNSLARGLEVLRAFNRTGRKMTVSQVASETGNTRAGARRILLTLVHEGYALTDGKLFDLTPQVLELGYSVLSSKGVWDIARPFIAQLSEEVRESVSAAILERFEVVYVAGTQYHRVISVGISVGSRFPAHCTANGRVLLAMTPEEDWDTILENIDLKKMTEKTVTRKSDFRNVLKKVRQQGWSLVDQELEIGLMSIAVPVRNSSGGIVGAINVGVPTIRMTPQQMVDEILPKLLATSENIGASLKAGH